MRKSTSSRPSVPPGARKEHTDTHLVRRIGGGRRDHRRLLLLHPAYAARQLCDDRWHPARPRTGPADRRPAGRASGTARRGLAGVPPGAHQAAATAHRDLSRRLVGHRRCRRPHPYPMAQVPHGPLLTLTARWPLAFARAENAPVRRLDGAVAGAQAATDTAGTGTSCLPHLAGRSRRPGAWPPRRALGRCYPCRHWCLDCSASLGYAGDLADSRRAASIQASVLAVAGEVLNSPSRGQPGRTAHQPRTLGGGYARVASLSFVLALGLYLGALVVGVVLLPVLVLGPDLLIELIFAGPLARIAASLLQLAY